MEAAGKKRKPVTEVLIALVGIGCIAYAVTQASIMPGFFGVCIVLGAFLLHFVRKKDWDAHWAELDRVRQAHEQRTTEEKREKERPQ